jgi:hypothetical protein
VDGTDGSNGIDGEIGLVGTGRTGPARQGSGAWCGVNLEREDELGRWNRLPLQCCCPIYRKVLEPSFTTSEEEKKRKKKRKIISFYMVPSRARIWSHACSLELELHVRCQWLFVVPRNFYNKKDGLGLGLAQPSPAQPTQGPPAFHPLPSPTTAEAVGRAVEPEA